MLSTSDRQPNSRYLIGKQIDEGHSAVVYSAQDTLLDREVALKCAKKGLIAQKPQYRALFAREAKHLASLDHPNIVPLYEFTESEDGPVIVMRLVQSSLHRVVNSHPNRKLPDLGVVPRQTAAALDCCADQGIAHRDVKPDNILIDQHGHLYLTDFGLAAPVDDNESWSRPVGARAFLSPEMFTERFIGGDLRRRRRTDQFSFGVMLYHLLTGYLPHDVEQGDGKERTGDWNDCTAMRLLRGQRSTPCCERDPKIPSRVDDVISRMLSVDPEDRYPSNIAATEALDEAFARHTNGDLKVFFSYSRSDRPVAEELVQYLENKGLTVWWDPQIEYGSDWEDQIEQAMLDCHVMVVILSERSATSPEVKNEWRYWLNFLKKPVITMVLRECRIPYRLFPKQHIYVQDRPMDTVAAEVATAIRKAAAASQAPPPSAEQRTTTATFSSASRHTPVEMNLFRLDVEEELKNAADAAYVPLGYRFDTLPNDLGDIINRLGKGQFFLPSGSQEGD